jgi:hypothetical protein
VRAAEANARQTPVELGPLRRRLEMEIPYASRSRFLGKCEETIRENLDDLQAGVPLRIQFESGGYNDRIKVMIEAANHNEFQTDWEKNDPTRFPARIKAAATALQNCSCAGKYEISHDDGIVIIRQI